jgi:23S rRNA (guanosine2251-2'-O)-methyltransferase
MGNTEILYGYHPVLEAIKAGRRKMIAVYIAAQKPSRRTHDIEQAAAAESIRLEWVADSRFRSLAGTGLHQGICARVGPYDVLEFSALLAQANHSDSFFLLLDSIVDPQNLGALIRSALCVGMDGVVIPKDRSASPTPAVSRASAGAMEHIRLSRVTNMTATIQRLKQAGVWVYGLDKYAPEIIYRCDLKGAVALVVGGEAQGIRPLVKNSCDRLISIPQKCELDSLNASAAGAVAMYEVFRQRLESGGQVCS